MSKTKFHGLKKHKLAILSQTLQKQTRYVTCSNLDQKSVFFFSILVNSFQNFKPHSVLDWKDFIVIDDSTHFDDYSWYLISRGKNL